MIAASVVKSTNTNDLVVRFHEDCNLRGMVSTMDYIHRAKEYCAFLETRSKNPLNADRDDLRAFLSRLKERGLKFKTINRIYSCLSAFYDFLIIDGLVAVQSIEKRTNVASNLPHFLLLDDEGRYWVYYKPPGINLFDVLI